MTGLERERKDDVFRITLASPPLNILTIAILDELHAAIEAAKKEPGLRALVLGAEGKTFSAGADIGEHFPERVSAMLSSFHRVFFDLYDLPLLTIALVDGPALGGGCELAAFCDMVIATERAKFGEPEVRLAALAPVATAIFPALVGPRAALRLLCSGASIGAEEACRLGLVTEVVPAAEALEAALGARLEEIGGTSPAVLGLAARAARRAAYPDFCERLSALERLYLEEVAPHPDAAEGLRAFLEKRPPRWADRSGGAK